jgi:hypothetical protein
MGGLTEEKRTGGKMNGLTDRQTEVQAGRQAERLIIYLFIYLK